MNKYMNKYTIWCTDEQTRKAWNLNAPLEIGEGKGTIECRYQNYHTYRRCIIPTTDQMIGWLEEQGILIDINPINGLHFYYMIRTKEYDEGSETYMWETQFTTPNGKEYECRKDAILSGIDVALEYLEKIWNT